MERNDHGEKRKVGVQSIETRNSVHWKKEKRKEE